MHDVKSNCQADCGCPRCIDISSRGLQADTQFYNLIGAVRGPADPQASYSLQRKSFFPFQMVCYVQVSQHVAQPLLVG